MKASDIKYGTKVLLAEIPLKHELPEALSSYSFDPKKGIKINCTRHTVSSWESCVFKGVFMLQVKFKNKMKVYFQITEDGTLVPPSDKTGRKHDYIPFLDEEEITAFITSCQNDVKDDLHETLQKRVEHGKRSLTEYQSKLENALRTLAENEEKLSVFEHMGFPPVQINVIETPKALD